MSVLADLEMREHSAMPGWRKLLGLHVRAVPVCEGGGYAIRESQANEIMRLVMKEKVGPSDLMVCDKNHLWNREKEGIECPRCNPGTGIADLLQTIAQLRRAGVPTQLQCPECGVQHVDEGEWATRPHRTHLCAACGWQWRPFEVATYGVAAVPATASEPHQPLPQKRRMRVDGRVVWALPDEDGRDQLITELRAEIARLKERSLEYVDTMIKLSGMADALMKKYGA